jgi:hypothetical protein
MIEPRLLLCVRSSLERLLPFQRFLDGFSEFQQGKGAQAHLLPTSSCCHHRSAAIRPLDRQPNEPTSRMLDINVLLPALAADGAYHRQAHALQGVDREGDAHPV